MRRKYLSSSLMWLVAISILLPACAYEQGREWQARVTSVETQLEALSRQVSQLQAEVVFQKVMLDRYETTALDPSEKGYGRVDTTSGFFLVSVEDAKPYLDGYKLTLHIGNPQFVTYSGFAIKAKWGPKFKGGGEDYAKWRAALQEKEARFTQTLRPGTWNKFEMVLSPAASGAVGYLEIGMSTSEVRMAQQW